MKSTILFPFFINGPFSKRVCIVKPTEEGAKSDSLKASLKEQSQGFLSKFLVQQAKKILKNLWQHCFGSARFGQQYVGSK